MSERSDHPEGDFERLEAELKRLQPTRLEAGFLEELGRDRGRIEAAAAPSRQPVARPPLARVLPLAALVCLLMLALFALRYGDRFAGPDEPATMASRDDAPGPRSPGTSSKVPALAGELLGSNSSFLPVSAQGYLVDTSTEGIRESEDGPVEKRVLEYRDAYHWHDPSTGTNIRLFTPRREQVLVPVPSSPPHDSSP